MKFHDKYYVGFQTERYSKTDDQRMLGFATPQDETKAFKSRKETVDRWRDKKIATVELINKPRYGFKIVDTVARYRGNKLFRVLDPEGFELEISAQNLFQIINECGIIKGVITDAMVWAQTKPYLISAASEEYQRHLTPTKNASHSAGKWMKHRTGNVFYRYEGKLFQVPVHLSVNRQDGNYVRDRWGYYNHPRLSSDVYDPSKVSTEISTRVERSQKSSVSVYTEWRLTEEGTLKKEPDVIHVRKSLFKEMVDLDEKELKIVPDYVLPKGQVIHKNLRHTAGYYSGYGVVLVDKKEEVENVTLTQEELDQAYQPLNRYNPRSSSYELDREYYGTVTTNIRYTDE